LFKIKPYPLGYKRTLMMPLYEGYDQDPEDAYVECPTLVDFQMIKDNHPPEDNMPAHLHLYLRFEESTRLTKSQFESIEPICNKITIYAWENPRGRSETFADSCLLKGEIEHKDVLESILRHSSVCEIAKVLRKLHQSGESKIMKCLLMKSPYCEIIQERGIQEQLAAAMLWSKMKDLEERCESMRCECGPECRPRTDPCSSTHEGSSTCGTE
jgi:hypothetical protein